MDNRNLTDSHLRILEKGTIECKDVKKLLGDYTDKELTSTLKARLDAHISGCPECQELHDSYKFTVQLASTLEDKPVPVDVQNRLRIALNAKLGLSLPLVGE